MSEVVVVLPFVPVTAIQLLGLSRKASSGSPMISALAAAAARKKALFSGMPGEATARSKAPSTSSVPSTQRTPIPSRARVASHSSERAPP